MNDLSSSFPETFICVVDAYSGMGFMHPIIPVIHERLKQWHATAHSPLQQH